MPLLFGDNFNTYIGNYAGYDPSVDATIPQAFAAAAMRFGDSMFDSSTDRYDGQGNCPPISPLSLRDAFLNPQQYYIRGGIDPLLHGMLSSNSMYLDEYVSIILTTQLFVRANESLGYDLASQNIQ